MRISQREIIFSVNSYCAAMLALYVSLCCDLERPYWAMMTAYIASQPFTGAVYSKAIYRIIGTVLGATMMVLIIPPLSNAPPLLSLVIALWVGICLFFSLLDRTPRSYVFLLAGYTTVFVGFPIISAPISVFDVAVARVEEICIGVMCSTLFHTVFFPRSLRQSLSHQFSDTVTDLQAWVVDTLARKKDAVRRRGRIRLAADITDLHLSATHI
ncbi:MAG: FUSC family protein, partial [Rhizomicrobium sp.]